MLPAFLAAGAVRAQAPDPAALQAAIAGARLDPARAVTLKNVKLGVGLGTLSLDDGVLIPATAVGGKTIEMVFLGKGRIEVEPPDAIEAGQLELFTGGSRLDEEFKEAVLVVGQDAAVSAVLQPAGGAAGRRADAPGGGALRGLAEEGGVEVHERRAGDPAQRPARSAWPRATSPPGSAAATWGTSSTACSRASGSR